MFSQVFVILSLNGGWGEVLQHQRPLDNTSLPPLDMVTTPPSPRDMVTTPPPPHYGQWAGGTHPTGMHSCHRLLILENVTLFDARNNLFSVHSIYLLHTYLQRCRTVRETRVFMATVMKINVSATNITWEKIAASSRNKVGA